MISNVFKPLSFCFDFSSFQTAHRNKNKLRTMSFAKFTGSYKKSKGTVNESWILNLNYFANS